MNFCKERPEQSIGFTMWQATNLWQRVTSEALVTIGLTHVQFLLLAGISWLTQQGHNVTQSMLAQHAKTDVMMTSKVLRTLETKGFIMRTNHDHDTRAKSVHMTNKGCEVLVEGLDIMECVDKEYFSILQNKEEYFLTMLQEVIQANTRCK